MTISTELRKAGPFAGNGATTAFPFSFKVFAASDVAVTRADTLGAETALVLNSDFTVALNPDQDAAPGGTITLAAPLATGHRLAVSSVVPNLQPTDITNNGGFYPRVIEDALDRHVAQIQQIDEKVDRALKVAVTSPLGDQALPSPVAGMLIGWNESNDGLKNYAPLGGTLLGQQLAAANGSSLVGFQQAGTGASPRTVQDKLREWVSVTDFGAVGDGVADDTAAFNSAIAYANSRGGIDYGNIVGTTIFVPDGRYKVGSMIPITRSGCEFVGASRNGAVLICTPGVTAFTFGDGANTLVGGGIKNCKVEYLAPPTVGTVLVAFDYAYRIALTDLLVANIGTLCRLGETSARPSGGITVDRVDGSKANVAIPLFDVRFGAGLFLNQVHVFVPVGAPVHPEPMTTVNGCSVFNCFSGFWDTLQVTNCLFERFDIGLSVASASGMVYQNLFFSNTIMDYFRRWCVYAEAQAGGVISGIRFDATSWFASWEADAISLSGSGYHDNHHFSGKVVIAGAAGVSYELTGARNIVFDSMQLNSCNRLGTAGGAMAFAAGAKGFSVLGCKGNVDTAAVGFAWRAPYGISVGADADRYVVANCAFEGSTGGYAFAANSSGSSYRKVANNLNANYAGPSAIALPSSGARYTNTSPFIEEWSFLGGTLTTGYDKNYQGLPGAMPYVHFRLQPGDTFSVGYSGAPITRTFIEP